MKFRANINIMPRKEILDPQGKATMHGLKNLDFSEISDLRIGKRIFMELEAKDKKTAEGKVDLACKKLLANLIMESYDFQLEEVK